MPQTLYDKLWDAHVVHSEEDGTALLYIDRHLVHEVTSPQAFEGLRVAGRPVWRTDSIVSTANHNTPTTDWHLGIDGIADAVAKEQIVTLDRNIKAFGALAYFPFLDKRQGIVHVIGPEQGATLPGMTVVCGDSHTSTLGAFACLAHGIGTSEVEHVLATQCLVTLKMKAMLIRIDGALGPAGITAKDMALAVIGQHRHGRRNGLCDRVRGQCGAGLVHGRAHDPVQHGHRGRCARAGDGGLSTKRPRPPISRGVTFAPKGAEDVVRRPGVLADPEAPMRVRQVRCRWSSCVARTSLPQVTWGTSPGNGD